MSQPNVDAVRRWTDAYNQRDIDALIELTDPDFEFRSSFVGLENVFRAYDGFPYAYFEMLNDAYERFQVLPSEFIDAGAAVVVDARALWRGKASGAEGETHVFPVFWLRARRLIRAEVFTDRAEALDAVGLPLR
jgi:ketosteroid isomerase-like protein